MQQSPSSKENQYDAELQQTIDGLLRNNKNLRAIPQPAQDAVLSRLAREVIADRKASAARIAKIKAETKVGLRTDMRCNFPLYIALAAVSIAFIAVSIALILLI